MTNSKIDELHAALTELEESAEVVKAADWTPETLRLRQAIVALEDDAATDVPPRLAGEIRLYRRDAGTGTPFELLVDGRPFPYAIATDPIVIMDGATPRIGVSILCERLAVFDTFGSEAFPATEETSTFRVPPGRKIENTEVHDRLAGKLGHDLDGTVEEPAP